MVKDLWVNMDRFSEMTNDIGDIGVEDARKYSDLSRQLGSEEVSVKDAILEAVTNPREFEENKTAMEAEVAARGSDPAKEFETIFIGAEAAALGEVTGGQDVGNEPKVPTGTERVGGKRELQ